jgi:hypothetical protein
MATINIDYSSLPFSDLGTNDCFQHGAFDFEMQQVPTSRSVRTSGKMAKLILYCQDYKPLLCTGNS